jgi:long-chain acyl-CoA synthetase
MSASTTPGQSPFIPPPPPRDARSIVDVLHDRVEKLGARAAFFRKVEGRWEPFSWRDYGRSVSRAAKALQKLGVERRSGVCILSFNRIEWVVADLAAMAAGAVPAGIYVTCSPDQCRYILEHCEASIVFVEDAAQLAKIREVKDRLPKLRWAVIFRPTPEALELPWVKSWDQFLAEGDSVPDAAYWELVKAIDPDALATLIYTSAPPGRPRA